MCACMRVKEGIIYVHKRREHVEEEAIQRQYTNMETKERTNQWRQES